jgi:hypothetical protein
VIVVGPGNKQGNVAFQDRGIDVLRTHLRRLIAACRT